MWSSGRSTFQVEGTTPWNFKHTSTVIIAGIFFKGPEMSSAQMNE